MLCLCGCGKKPKLKGSSYCLGHYSRVYNYTGGNKGKKWSAKVRRVTVINIKSALNNKGHLTSNNCPIGYHWDIDIQRCVIDLCTKKCKCGCGKIVKSKKKNYCWGHNPTHMSKSGKASVSKRMKGLHSNPKYRKKRHNSLVNAWKNPNSGFNSVTHKLAMREWQIKAWADPNSKHHTREQGGGFGHLYISPDGHHCRSTLELTFEKWLIKNKIAHNPHPKIPGTRDRRADQLVNNFYIEIDGMGRTEKYWEDRYKSLNLISIIIPESSLSNKGLEPLLDILK